MNWKEWSFDGTFDGKAAFFNDDYMLWMGWVGQWSKSQLSFIAVKEWIRVVITTGCVVSFILLINSIKEAERDRELVKKSAWSVEL
jgi:hypothetical protein